MDEILRPLFGLRTLSLDTFVSLIDILLVSFLIYKLLTLIRGTRAWRLITGIVIFLLFLFLSKRLGLYAVDWMLEKAIILGPVALVILFLPELRQALEGFGKLGIWSQRIAGFEPAEPQTVEEIVEASAELAAARVGAIIIVERGAPLNEIAERGVPLDARVTAPLLGAIFYSGNPLHDGAVIVRRGRVAAAACRLPFSDNPRLAANLHMRHRAAVGVTEQTDCVAVVVSEERGTISYVVEGHLRRMSPQDLREALNRDLRGEEAPNRPEWTKRWSIIRPKEKRVGPPVS